MPAWDQAQISRGEVPSTYVVRSCGHCLHDVHTGVSCSLKVRAANVHLRPAHVTPTQAVLPARRGISWLGAGKTKGGVARDGVRNGGDHTLRGASFVHCAHTPRITNRQRQQYAATAHVEAVCGIQLRLGEHHRWVVIQRDGAAVVRRLKGKGGRGIDRSVSLAVMFVQDKGNGRFGQRQAQVPKALLLTRCPSSRQGRGSWHR